MNSWAWGYCLIGALVSLVAVWLLWQNRKVSAAIGWEEEAGLHYDILFCLVLGIFWPVVIALLVFALIICWRAGEE